MGASPETSGAADGGEESTLAKDFVRRVAHDFNNLLTVIRARVESALEDPHVPEQTKESLQQVMVAADRAVHLTRQLSQFGRQASARSEAVKGSGDDLERWRGGGEKILFVERDPMLRRFLGLLLERLGYLVEAAGSGTEARELWNTNPARFAVLVAEANASDGSGGTQLLQEFRKTRPQLRAVLVLEPVSAASRRVAGKDGVWEVPRPIVPEKLAAAVRECLSKPF
jgi:CheY-like chemotaxis protein